MPNRPSKSLSNETTFSENLVSLEDCSKAITELAVEMLAEWRLEAPERRVRKAFIKIKYADFTRTTKECLCAEPDVSTYHQLLTEAYQHKDHPVRLLGTGVRFAEASDFQPELF